MIRTYKPATCLHVWIGVGDWVYCVSECGVHVLAIPTKPYGFCEPPSFVIEAVTKAIEVKK